MNQIKEKINLLMKYIKQIDLYEYNKQKIEVISFEMLNDSLIKGELEFLHIFLSSKIYTSMKADKSIIKEKINNFNYEGIKNEDVVKYILYILIIDIIKSAMKYENFYIQKN
jgi:hypothetical protein